MDAVADALRDQGSTRPAAEALDRGDLAAAAQQLRELADQASQLSEEARQQLADSLRRAAAKVQPSDPDLAQQLRDSARGLERGQDRAAQALEDLARAIEQQGQPGGQAGLPGDPSQQQGAGDQPGSSGGAGNSGAGERRPVENPTRLGVDGKPLPLDVQGEGSTSAPPPEQATAGNLSAVGTAAGGGSGGDGSSGPDPLRVPMDERDVVQDYFSR
jgi:hypothetical protein